MYWQTLTVVSLLAEMMFLPPQQSTMSLTQSVWCSMDCRYGSFGFCTFHILNIHNEFRHNFFKAALFGFSSRIEFGDMKVEITSSQINVKLKNQSQWILSNLRP